MRFHFLFFQACPNLLRLHLHYENINQKLQRCQIPSSTYPKYLQERTLTLFPFHQRAADNIDTYQRQTSTPTLIQSHQNWIENNLSTVWQIITDLQRGFESSVSYSTPIRHKNVSQDILLILGTYRHCKANTMLRQEV